MPNSYRRKKRRLLIPKLVDAIYSEDNSLLLTFDHPIKQCAIQYNTCIAPDIGSHKAAVPLRLLRNSTGDQGTVSISFLPADMNSNEYSVVVHLSFHKSRWPLFGRLFDCSDVDTGNMVHFVEIIRQSPTWLRNTFSYNTTRGYSILGRRSVLVGEPAGVINGPAISFSEVPNSACFDNATSFDCSSYSRMPKEIQTVCKILRFLWDLPVDTSPSDAPYADFLELPFAEKLERIRSKQMTLSCQGMRDLFLHAALAFPELKVRGVNAYNYAPQFPDLISYSHATCEVFVKQSNKWVITDPYFCAAFSNKQGFLLSAADLQNSIDAIYSIPLIPSMVYPHMVPFRKAKAEIQSGVIYYTSTGHMMSPQTHFHSLEYFTVENRMTQG